MSIDIIKKEVYARVGLAGNPSDGFYGKTVSACIKNFSAEVVLEEAKSIFIDSNPVMDPIEFSSVDALIDHSERYGYYGALRLIHATCSLFFKTCLVKLISGRGFTIKYASSIPRQVGLGGSSAIVVALLKALVEFVGAEEYFPPERLATLAWRVENEELGITAGLQDRVIQTYGGLVYMDFDEEYMAEHGYGKYYRMRYFDKRYPDAFIAYTDSPRKFSGQMHNPIHFAFESLDGRVCDYMRMFAELAYRAYAAYGIANYEKLGIVMRRNWQLRLELYGDELIGADNIEMIAIANKHGCPAKLPGSGGAVIGLYDSEETYQELFTDYEEHGYHCIKVEWG